MTTYLCDDGNAELQIEADSAEDAAQEYVDGGDWGDRSETCWINVYVEEIIADTKQRSAEVSAAIEYVHSHDDDTADSDGVAEAFRQFFGREPDSEDDPWSDLCAAIGADDTADDHADMLDPILGDRECVKITLDAEEPACDASEHDWQSPYSVLGGLEENPGVQGNGGGVVIKTVCAHCGRYKITDTWAQDPETGEQGLESVSYEDADEASSEWAQRRRKAALRKRIESVLDTEGRVESYHDGEGCVITHATVADGVDAQDLYYDLCRSLGDGVEVIYPLTASSAIRIELP